MTDFAELRERMVERQIAARRIRDPALLEAGRLVYFAGRMQKRRYADPSSPLTGLI